ncbi:DUF494 family protein [Parachitinimonas caeni]|uniref:Protein Smg homolog n=1 Tax=Parachitinimonas caeni TaxID=3031301 RepID=A0ABT7E0Y4_9NEIS|nr:DUF494 domain-containing protein [Parachitinimonas caeni]MDK2124988.1 DUF494 domain-containing protein [Parachitinimonas caeni]
MFDILAYLFEQYYHTDGYPDQHTLAKRLAAAGFDGPDIDEALDWLDALSKLDAGRYQQLQHIPATERHLHPLEAARLTPEAHAFLHYLSHSGGFNAAQLELVLDRIMQLDTHSVDLEQMKVAVLMVLWRQGDDLANLLIEELLYAGDDAPMH